MGCAPPPKQTVTQPSETLFGYLHVSLINAEFNPNSGIKNPVIKTTVSNQSYTTNIGTGLKPLYNENYEFAINSVYKPQGRHIQVDVLEGNDVIGTGSTDVNPVIGDKGQTNEFRVIINHNKKQVGQLNLKASFQEVPYQLITFRFQTATIRHRTNSFGDLNVAVSVTIGEEVLQTNFDKDIENHPPIWRDQVLTFRVPKRLKQGSIEVIDDHAREVGRSGLDLTNLLKTPEGQQIYVSQQVFFNGIDAANLKYSYMLGEAAFSAIKDVLKSSKHA